MPFKFTSPACWLLVFNCIFGPVYQARADNLLPLGVNVSVGRSFYKSVNPDFENFRKSYNEEFSSVLTQKMGPISYRPATYWSVGFIGASIGIDFIRARHEGFTKGVQTNGSAREFKIIEKTTQFEFSLCIPFREYFSGGISIGLIKYNGTVYSGFRYPSGNVSYGMEKRLNGVYTNDGHDLLLGFKLKAGYKYGFLFMRYNWFGMFYKRNDYNHELGWTDELAGGSRFYNNYHFPTRLADDIQNINNPNVTVNHSDNRFVGLHSKGHIFQFGISVFLGAYFEYSN